MEQYRTIEIDFDVHKLIENERRSFEETANAALRRLLGLPERTARVGKPISQRRSWVDKGVTLPHGTEVRMDYSGRSYVGQIIDGEWVVGQERFDSPSGAASGIALTKKGNRTKLDGWKYWSVRRPGETNWTPLSQIRPKLEVLDIANLTDADFQS